MKKNLIKVVAVLLLLLVVLVGGVFFYLDSIAKSAIERGATFALGVETTLDSADVGVTSGSFAMSGLTVMNPDGYDTPHFLALGTGRTEVSLGSLREDVIRIPVLDLAEIDVQLEKKQGKANYEQILENLKRLEQGGEPAEPAEEGRKFVIDRVTVRDITVHANLLPVGGNLTRSEIGIEEIVLEDVGSGGKGLTMDELVSVLTKAIFTAIIESGGDLPGDLLAGLQGGLSELVSLENLGVSVEGMTGSIGEITESAGDAVKEAGEGIGKSIEGLGGLLGGKKKNEEPDGE